MLLVLWCLLVSSRLVIRQHLARSPLVPVLYSYFTCVRVSLSVRSPLDHIDRNSCTQLGTQLCPSLLRAALPHHVYSHYSSIIRIHKCERSFVTPWMNSFIAPNNRRLTNRRAFHHTGTYFLLFLLCYAELWWRTIAKPSSCSHSQ